MTDMTCPNCGTRISSDSVRCPACHADLGLTMRIPRQRGTWCSACGAQVPADASVCPSCGTPVGAATSARRLAATIPAITTPDDREDRMAGTARIESALPAEPTPYSEPAETERSPFAPRVLVAAVFAVVAMGAVALAITHPWDPNAFSIKATTEADTSKVGFPGELETLSAQDKAAATETAEPEQSISADEATYQALKADWDELGELEAALSANEARLRAFASGETVDVAAMTAEAGSLAISVSNNVASAEGADVSTGTYAEAATNVATLGNWLRNWADALIEAWDRAGIATSVASAAEAAVPLDEVAEADGTNAYHALFVRSYAAWEPQEP